ncbi:hypothetical protein ANO11243_016670 [Dothideomycetidae sp. 11243]|nr:hypothetical protein ANO11243_016670 [fungal sp. No.11243]
MRISPRSPLHGSSYTASQADVRTAALIWSLAAALSLITARQLLLLPHGHHPLHLLILQLAVACAWRVLNPPRQVNAPLAERSSYHSRPSTAKRVSLVLLDILSFAVSLPFYVQAILNFSSTAVLSMLSLSVFLHPIVASLVSGAAIKGLHARRLFILVTSLALLLYYEYRLTAGGLFYGIASFAVYGFFQSIRYMVNSEYASFRSGLNSAPVLLLTTVITCLVAFATEDTHAARLWLFTLDRPLLIVLAINLVSTTTAFRVGGNIFVFNGGFDRISWIGFQQSTVIWPLLCTSGIVALYTARAQLSVMYHLQLVCCLAAAASLLDVNFSFISEQFRNEKLAPLQRLNPLFTLMPRDRHLASPTLSQDEEDGVDRKHPTRRSLANLDAQRSAPTRFLVLVTVFCWAASLWISLFDPGPPSDVFPRPVLDLDYNASSELDIVISSSVEHPSELAQTVELLMSIPAIYTRDARIFIYSKNYQADLGRLRRAVMPSFETPSIMLTQNIGAEGETYLAHILSHWETLGNHTLFLKASPENPDDLKARIAKFFHSETGMLPLSASESTCACDSDTCSDSSWTDNSGVVRDVFLHANRRQTCHPGERLLLSSSGQFIASAARIRGVEVAVYRQLRSWIVDDSSWVHHNPFLAGKRDHMANPVFGKALERLWAGLLQCADPNIARYCPSIMSGWRPGGSLRDCQCLDAAEPVNDVFAGFVDDEDIDLNDLDDLEDEEVNEEFEGNKQWNRGWDKTDKAGKLKNFDDEDDEKPARRLRDIVNENKAARRLRDKMALDEDEKPARRSWSRPWGKKTKPKRDKFEDVNGY